MCNTYETTSPGIMYCIKKDLTVACMSCKYAFVCIRPGNKIISYNETRTMSAFTTGTAITQTNTTIIIDEDVSFYYTIISIMPHENSPTPGSGASLNSYKYIVTDGPVPGTHNINTSYIIAIEVIRIFIFIRFVIQLLRSIVVK